MSGGLNPDHTSDVPISQNSKCEHGVYRPSDDPNAPNMACSICRSEAGKKKPSDPIDWKSVKRQNDIWK